MPLPSGLDDRLGALILWLPTKQLPGKAGIGNQLRRIAWPSRTNDFLNVASGNFSTRFNDLANAKPNSRT